MAKARKTKLLKAATKTRVGIRHAMVLGIAIVAGGVVIGTFLAGIISSFSTFRVSALPVIVNVSPPRGVNGDLITIHGNNFGSNWGLPYDQPLENQWGIPYDQERSDGSFGLDPTGGSNMVYFRASLHVIPGFEERFGQVVSWANNEIEVFVPNFYNKLCRSPQSEVDIVVRAVKANGQESNEAHLNFDCRRATIIDRLAPSRGNAGDVVVMQGRSFSKEQGSQAVFFGGDQSGWNPARVISWSNSMIKVAVPPKSGPAGASDVSVGILEPITYHTVTGEHIHYRVSNIKTFRYMR